MNKIAINSNFGIFSLSVKAVDWINEHYPEYDLEYGSDWDLKHYPRHAKALIECVETLGKEASGEFSKITLATIPGNRYRIKDVNGYEILETPIDDENWIKIE